MTTTMINQTPAEAVIKDLKKTLTGLLRLTAVDGVDTIEAVRKSVNEWLDLERARVIADEYYLGDGTFRGIARRIGISHNTPNFWLNDLGLGPAHYVAVRLTDDGYETQKLEPDQAGLKNLAAKGYRIAPSTMLLDLAQDGVEVDPEWLWNKLGGRSAVAVQQARPVVDAAPSRPANRKPRPPASGYDGEGQPVYAENAADVGLIRESA